MFPLQFIFVSSSSPIPTLVLLKFSSEVLRVDRVDDQVSCSECKDHAQYLQLQNLLLQWLYIRVRIEDETVAVDSDGDCDSSVGSDHEGVVSFLSKTYFFNLDNSPSTIN